MQTHSYSWLSAQVAQLTTILKAQASLGVKLGSDEAGTEQLKELTHRLETEDFKVLLMGVFSSGKSTFINALLGKRILPAKMKPSTAIICEVRYAEETKCILYPKPGKYVDRKSGLVTNEPFEIKVEELKDYILIDQEVDDSDKEPVLKDAYFEKLELFWPLGICKEKVTLIDSPGLNDPDSHDTITLEYLPRTDAIIYCMNCANAYSAIDKQTIAELQRIGYQSIIFVLTNFDRFADAADPGEDQDFIRSMKSTLGKFTDLGPEGVLFVNSLGGVRGKENSDLDLLEKSNILAAENTVEGHLVGQRGVARLVIGAQRLKNHNEATAKSIDRQLKLNELSTEDHQKAQKRLKDLLEDARTKSELMITKLQLGIQGILTRVDDLGHAYFNSLDDEIAAWVNDHQPTTKVNNPLMIRTQIEARVNEYMGHIKHKMKLNSYAWAAETLNPMISAGIKKIADDTQDLQAAYQHTLNEYEVEINMGEVDQQITEEVEPSALSTFGAILYGVVSGDVLGAGMGLAFGFKGLLTSVGAQIAAVIVLYIASLFTPVGIAVFIIGAIVAALGAGVWNLTSIPGTIRKAVIEKTQKTLRDREFQDKVIGNIKDNIKTELDKLVAVVKEAFDSDIKPKQAELDRANEAHQKDTQALQAQKTLLLECKQENEAIARQIKMFAGTIKR